MKQTTKKGALVLGLIALATASLPALAESVDLRVVGTITPAACTPTLGGGGRVDYGAISPSQLSEDKLVALPHHDVAFSINCTGPAKVAIAPIEGRPGTAIGTAMVSGYTAPPKGIPFFIYADHVGGLGLNGTKKIGGYGIYLDRPSAMADGIPVDTIYQNDDWGNEWRSNEVISLFGPNRRKTTWAATGTTLPVAFTTFTGILQIQAFLNTSKELDIKEPIALDGLTTLELVYL